MFDLLKHDTKIYRLSKGMSIHGSYALRDMCDAVGENALWMATFGALHDQF